MIRWGEFIGCIVIGVVAGGIVTVAASPEPPPAPVPIPVTGQAPGGQALEESDLGWNWLTMGNQTCGPNWSPLTAGERSELVRQHAGLTAWEDGDDPWQGCVTDAVTVACPDGYVYVWWEDVFIGGQV